MRDRLSPTFRTWDKLGRALAGRMADEAGPFGPAAGVAQHGHFPERGDRSSDSRFAGKATEKDTKMRLGLFMMPIHPPTRTLSAYLAETTEKSLLAERLGFDELWLGEHFSANSEPIPSPLMFMASLVPQTKRLVFGTGVINLPNRHPAVIAAEVAQFDHMSGGRFMFGIGTGSLPSDYELFNVADEPLRRRMLLESIDMIQKIWAQGPPYTFKGEYWSFGIERAISSEFGIGFMPKPLRPGGPPVCISISSPNSHTAHLAGVRGWGPVSSGLISSAALASHWQAYADGCREAARAPDGNAWRVVRCVHVAGSDAEARARVFSAESAYRYYFSYLFGVLKRANRLAPLKPHPDMPDNEVTVDGIIEARVIHGSPATVATKLAALRAEVGPFGHLLLTGMDWGGPNAAWERESMRRLAEEVMPVFHRQAEIREAVPQGAL
jgi:alkanesulfonate monooxygenase SsuD/methylene tetrahydromethanopterin reductase-like flavin-dependent oxidoreductase (luciferase family)